MIVGTGGTTGRPKGVMLTGRNLETMTALTLMGYPFDGRPVYLALAPLTHAAGVLCFPVLALGGEIVIMRDARRRRVPRADRAAPGDPHVPAADAVYMLLARPTSTRRIFVAAVLLVRRGADVGDPARGGADPDRPVMAQLFGQTEAPMMISTMAPGRPLPCRTAPSPASGSSSAGRPAPLVTVAIMDDDGLLPRGRARRDRGPQLAGDGRLLPQPGGDRGGLGHGWHHTGDIGYLDDDNFLFIVDRAKDMIITGGFNVYSTEVEQALMATRPCRTAP